MNFYSTVTKNLSMYEGCGKKTTCEEGEGEVRKKKKLFGNLCWLLVNLAGREAALVTLLE